MADRMIGMILRVTLTKCFNDERATSCAQCCLPYSFVGSLFMLWVVLMLTHQPFYIQGIDNTKTCKDNAFGAMILFITLMIVSQSYLCYRQKISQWSRHTNHSLLGTEDESDTEFLFPRGMSDYSVEVDSEHYPNMNMQQNSIVVDDVIEQENNSSQQPSLRRRNNNSDSVVELPALT